MIETTALKFYVNIYAFFLSNIYNVRSHIHHFSPEIKMLLFMLWSSSSSIVSNSL